MDDFIPVMMLLGFVVILMVMFWKVRKLNSETCPICKRSGAKLIPTEWGTRIDCENCGSVMT